MSMYGFTNEQNMLLAQKGGRCGGSGGGGGRGSSSVQEGFLEEEGQEWKAGKGLNRW